MITRRTLILNGTAGLSASALAAFRPRSPPLANDPVAVVHAIYAGAAKGKGDGGGAFAWSPVCIRGLADLPECRTGIH